MLYTTYFSKLRDLPDDIVPVAICGKKPGWFIGAHYAKLAPKYRFFMEYKKNHDVCYYVDHFNSEVLSHLDPQKVHQELVQLTGNDNIALVCYESPEKFCHRHLVRNWFMSHGVFIKEFQEEKFKVWQVNQLGGVQNV